MHMDAFKNLTIVDRFLADGHYELRVLANPLPNLHCFSHQLFGIIWLPCHKTPLYTPLIQNPDLPPVPQTC
ncbi:hypothetical protein E2C01_020920 [Portunus trituberculatus]|uniref:Uncharacterized protein n=1 Tax=Portunus trituberculatus TaxID=210409 RepID=A0A5B7E1F6_PORTR|nr:hypothetical protein [Portunus trituberculatus]